MTEASLHSFYKGKKVLVTGGNGFIGSSVIQSLQNFSTTIINVSRQPHGNMIASPIISEVTGDYSVRFWKDIVAGVDIVFHFAAQTSSSYANAHPSQDFKSNIAAVVSLLEACQMTGKRPIVVFAGSVTQTGLTTTVPVNENRFDKPSTIYDVSKLLSEQYIRYYACQMQGFGVTLRLANVYGPGPMNSSADRGILNLMVRKAIRGEDLTIYGTGAYTRDYVFISDVVAAFVEAAAVISETNGKHYIVGTGSGHTVAEMIHLVSESVFDLTGKKSTVISVPEPQDLPEIEHRHFVADTTALQSDTGWRAQVDLKTGIDKTVKYYLNINI